jgi:hypothetical protein
MAKTKVPLNLGTWGEASDKCELPVFGSCLQLFAACFCSILQPSQQPFAAVCGLI